MNNTVVYTEYNIGGDYYIRQEIGHINNLRIVYVEICHPNSGWGPWFLLAKVPSFCGWTFLPLSNANEGHIRKTLKGLRQLPLTVQQWLRKERT